MSLKFVTHRARTNAALPQAEHVLAPKGGLALYAAQRRLAVRETHLNELDHFRLSPVHLQRDAPLDFFIRKIGFNIADPPCHLLPSPGEHRCASGYLFRVRHRFPTSLVFEVDF